MSLLKKLSKIDNYTKYGVYGWIRQAEEELNIGHVPPIISNICILYYTEDEIFDRIMNMEATNLEISKDKKCVKTIKRTEFISIAVGIIEVASTLPMEYLWHLRIKNCEEGIIGITSTKDSEYKRLDQYGAHSTIWEQKGNKYLHYSGGKKYYKPRRE